VRRLRSVNEVVNPAPSSPITSSQRAKLLDRAESLAWWLGEPDPENITAVPTTRDAANKLARAGVTIDATGQPDTTGVYLVQATGHFTSRRAPPGVPSPSGSALHFNVDVNDRLLDWGISPSPLSQAELENLGVTTALQPRSRPTPPP
jgi:hypothetical protein